MTASDFTEWYWPESSLESVCPTTFKALPAPRFISKTESKGKSVVRSNKFREDDEGGRYFTGNVKVQHDDLLLAAQELVWVNDGPLKFDEGLSIYHAQGAMSMTEAIIDFDKGTKSASLGDLSYVFFDRPLQGSLMSLKADDALVEATDLRFSGCDPRAERWDVRVKHISINRASTRVTLRGIGFYVGKLPVFYLPYFTIRPQVKENGFASTRFRYRSDNGLIVGQPIRFFGNSANVELEPRYLTKNGGQLGAQVNFRGVKSTIDWVPRDKELKNLNDSRIDSSRWRVKVNHDGNWRGLDTLIDFTQTSDFAYQHDFEFDALTQPQFSTDNTAALSHTSRDWNLKLVAQRFNSTSEDRILGERNPELDLIWQPQWGVLSATSYVNGATYRAPSLRSHRGHIEQSLQTQLNPAWGELMVGATKAITRFSIDTGEFDGTHTRHIFSVKLGAGLFFDKTQPEHIYALEPRFFYIDRTFTPPALPTLFDSPRWVAHTAQIFDEARTGGLDHIPGERRFTGGFRLHVRPTSSSRNKFRAEIAHVTHPDGSDGISQRMNGWVSSLRVQNAKGFALEHRQYQSADNAVMNEFSTLAVYEPTPTKSIYASLGKRARDHIHQSEIGFRWPLSRHWETIGAVKFDQLSDRVIDAHLGVVFSGCCYRTMLFVQRAIDWNFNDGRYLVEPENRVMVRFDLSGLGTIGRTRIESLIERKHFGFH